MKDFYFYYKGRRVTFYHDLDFSQYSGLFEYSEHASIKFDGGWHEQNHELGREIESKIILSCQNNYIIKGNYEITDINPQYDKKSSHVSQIVWSNQYLIMREESGVTTLAVETRGNYRNAAQYNLSMFYSSIFAFIEDNFANDIIFDEDQLSIYNKIKTALLREKSIQYRSAGYDAQGDGFKESIRKHTEAVQAVKNDIKTQINNIILAYEDSGRKFYLFEQHPDRVNTIQTLVDDIALILKADTTTTSIKALQLQMALVMYRAIIRTRQSHQDKIGFAMFGATKSRFAMLLTNYLNAFMESAKITQNEFDQALIAEKPVHLPVKYSWIK